MLFQKQIPSYLKNPNQKVHKTIFITDAWTPKSKSNHPNSSFNIVIHIFGSNPKLDASYLSSSLTQYPNANPIRINLIQIPPSLQIWPQI